MNTILIAPDNFNPQQWNNLATHPMQSWEWGEIRKAEGKRIVRFVEYEKENIRAVYLMTVHPIPYLPYSIGYIPKSDPPSDTFLSYLNDYGKKHKMLFIKFEPNNLHKTQNTKHVTQLIVSSHPLFTQWNQILDISTSEDDLLKSMHHKTRYNIRLAEKKGVTIHQMDTDAGYAIFEQLYFDTCKRQHYHGHSPTYHRNIWNHLSQQSSVDSRQSTVDSQQPVLESLRGVSERNDEAISQNAGLTSHILVAYYQDVPLAVFQLWHYKNTLYYVYGGSSEEHKNVMAANLLMWEAIRLGKSLGCAQLDMWGSLPPKYDTQDPWAGFTKFKEGYGTKFVEYVGSYDLVVNKFAYSLYSLVHIIRSRVL